jgi:hypothetical protein
MERHEELIRDAKWPLQPTLWEMEPIFHIKTNNQIETYEFQFYSSNKCKKYFDEFMMSTGCKVNRTNNCQLNNLKQKELLKNVLSCTKKLDYEKLYEHRNAYKLNRTTVICCELDL